MQMAFGIFLHASVLLLKRDCGFPFSICLGTSEMHIATVASSIASVDVRREWQFHVRFAQWLCRCVRVLPNSYVQWKKGRPSFLDFCWQAFAGRKREERERAILHFFGHRMSSISGKHSSKTLVGNGSIAPCDDQQ